VWAGTSIPEIINDVTRRLTWFSEDLDVPIKDCRKDATYNLFLYPEGCSCFFPEYLQDLCFFNHHESGNTHGYSRREANPPIDMTRTH
jgi:hypothetical protein